MKLAKLVALGVCLLSSAVAVRAQAFSYVVRPRDTLASIAERFYGRIQHEKLLVEANVLNAQGGTSIVAGMRLQVPALSHRRVRRGDTWGDLAAELLGSARRSDVLARANGTSPWLPPEEGSEIVVPYNLRVIVRSGDTIVTIAYKFLGDRNQAWVLDHYNGFKGRKLRRGDVVLVPLVDLPLTDEGKAFARRALQVRRSEGGGTTREIQRRVRNELPALHADIKSGRYVDAVSRGNRFLAAGELDRATLASVHRDLLEAYVALGATGLATAACNEWRKADPSAPLDPVMLSPKIIAACERGDAPTPAE